MNIGAMTMEKIQNLLFDNAAPWNNPGAGLHGRRHQVDQTFLCEMMKALVSRSERTMQAQVFKLEWNQRCFTRIRQILKHNIPNNSSNPFHPFMGSCLRDMREILYDLDRVLSRMRTASQFLGDVDRRMRTGRTGGPISSVWVGQPFGSREYVQQHQRSSTNPNRVGVASGSGSVHQPNRPNVGPPRGRQMERGSRGASIPIAGVGIVRPTVGWYNFLEQVERGGPAGRGKGKGKGNGKGRSNVGAGNVGGAGRPGPSGAGSGAGGRGGSGAGARSGPSGRDSPSALRLNVRGRTRDPSRSPRPKRDSTRSRSRLRTTGRMPSPPPLTDTSRSRSRSRATEESSDIEGRSRSRTPRSPKRSPRRSPRSPPRTGNREVRVSQDEAIELSSGEYMDTDM